MAETLPVFECLTDPEHYNAVPEGGEERARQLSRPSRCWTHRRRGDEVSFHEGAAGVYVDSKESVPEKERKSRRDVEVSASPDILQLSSDE